MKQRARLEQLYCGRQGFQIDGSPLQRAICRAADGVAIDDALLDDDALERHFGCGRLRIGLFAPVVVVLVAGVRSGKSSMAFAAAVRCALTADLSQLRPHEVARVVIVGPTVQNASDTFRLGAGYVDGSPLLAPLVVARTAEALTIRRPSDGRLVELVVVAAHRGAVTLRGVWIAGVILEEAAQIGAEVTGAAISAEELLRAGETRLLPGGQIWIITSPFGPQGLVYGLWKTHFGTPGRVLVVHAPTQAMNPTFDVAQIEAIRAEQPDVAAREYDAQWIDAVSSLLDGVRVDACVRASPVEIEPSAGSWVAAWDAGTRGNSWTIVLARVTANADPEQGPTRISIGLAREWKGSRSAPLSPDKVIEEIGCILSRYSVHEVRCDRWSIDALRPLAARAGFDLVETTLGTTGPNAERAYSKLKQMVAAGTIELAPVPHLVTDLKSIRKRALSNGVRFELPTTPDGRHCDYVPPIALLCDVAEVASVTPADMRLVFGRESQRAADLSAWASHRERRNPLDRYEPSERLKRFLNDER